MERRKKSGEGSTTAIRMYEGLPSPDGCVIANTLSYSLMKQSHFDYGVYAVLECNNSSYCIINVVRSP